MLPAMLCSFCVACWIFAYMFCLWISKSLFVVSQTNWWFPLICTLCVLATIKFDMHLFSTKPHNLMDEIHDYMLGCGYDFVCMSFLRGIEYGKILCEVKCGGLLASISTQNIAVCAVFKRRFIQNVSTLNIQHIKLVVVVTVHNFFFNTKFQSA